MAGERAAARANKTTTLRLREIGFMAPQTEMQETAERRTGIAVENKGKTKKARIKRKLVRCRGGLHYDSCSGSPAHFAKRVENQES